MKIAMSFLFALLFSVSASAATLSIKTTSFTQQVTPDGTTVIGSGSEKGIWSSIFELSSDEDTTVNIVWAYNPNTNVKKSSFVFNGIEESTTTSPNFTKTFSLKANTIYKVGFNEIDSAPVNYSVSATVSAVPVPAAALLFAPALVGFMAIRRKASK